MTAATSLPILTIGDTITAVDERSGVTVAAITVTGSQGNEVAIRQDGINALVTVSDLGREVDNWRSAGLAVRVLAQQPSLIPADLVPNSLLPNVNTGELAAGTILTIGGLATAAVGRTATEQLLGIALTLGGLGVGAYGLGVRFGGSSTPPGTSSTPPSGSATQPPETQGTPISTVPDYLLLLTDTGSYDLRYRAGKVPYTNAAASLVFVWKVRNAGTVMASYAPTLRFTRQQKLAPDLNMVTVNPDLTWSTPSEVELFSLGLKNVLLSGVGTPVGASGVTLAPGEQGQVAATLNLDLGNVHHDEAAGPPASLITPSWDGWKIEVGIVNLQNASPAAYWTVSQAFDVEPS